MQTKEIAIIGGGIAGLTLAVSLRNTRFKCHIFEKNAEFKEIGAAISVFPNALRVLRQYGLLNDILNVGGAITKICMKTDQGKILAQTEPRYQLPAMCMHRADLHAILLKHADATFYASHELNAFQSTPDGKVSVSFKNGVFRIFDAVIGADGLHSLVRQGIIGDGEPIFRGYNIWRGIAESNIDIRYASESYGKGKRVGIVPIRDGQCGWWTTVNEKFMESDEPEETKQKLLRLFADWHDPIPELISKTDHIIKNSLSDRIPVSGWSKGNCTLLGDAAHPTTPTLGQGGCIAIEGAYILGEIIKKYGVTESVFQRYESLHYHRAKSIIEDSLQLGKIGQLENSMAVYLRNLLMGLTPSSFTLKVVDKYFLYDVTSMKI
ncbi:FAD-dependent monooxygenase [Dyadobacter fanqingshengii]|uniref:FAD-dependent monooxygenase n=1 Tax=Dyadobacter fanqingshengii TaxID=2906443 RepID=A0A9X1PCJ1_9BACT|nr:FAD-dependent monooxygenase [Dyadobacter fanqingshengii]MCF0041684.1 FAD-dependent monooxygenase [Dyadobacter fanqingshengii]USJ36602.1 FAD-dependent monooxygenase [Dyadobacter fanqingshengii]